MKILICSDGHPQAEAAARFICGGIAGEGTEITLLGIIEHPSDQAALDESLRLSSSVLREKGATVETVTRSGLPVAEIQRQAREKQYDFVVIGAEHKDGGPFALSTKAYHLIKEVAPPVLVMIGQRTEMKKILICSGGNAAIEQAVKLTGDLACRGEPNVTILHVLAEAPIIYSDLQKEEEDVRHLLATNSSLAKNLRRELEAFTARGIQAQIKLRHGLVSAEIVREVSDGGYDLVVAGSAPSGGALRTYVMGDVTSEIVNRADCPVLVVRGLPRTKKGNWWDRLFSRGGKAES